MSDTVIEKMIGKCRLAYQSGSPFIMIDTEELELVDELILQSGIVDLLEAPQEEAVRSQRWLPYFQFLGGSPGGLAACVNFYTDEKKLTELARDAGDPDRTMGLAASVFSLHLMKNGRAERLNALRSYAAAYLRCRDMNSVLRRSLVVLYGDVSALPQDLKTYTEIIGVEYPQPREVMDIVAQMAGESGNPIELEQDLQEITREMAGFGLMQVKRTLRRLLWADYKGGRPLLFHKEERDRIILEAKKQVLLQNGGLLELQRKPDPGSRKKTLGGMKRYREWVSAHAARMSRSEEYLRRRGVGRLKGILLCGVPGCGKSEAAKILQQEWNLPLIKMSVDQLMGGYVGDSERNMRQALRQAEAMSPCILWIDELDKGFSGSARNGQDNATFKRMFGRFLTWMQENTSPCFIFATANDIGELPPEFFRSGRFDELFSIYMPRKDECIEIFREHMHRAQDRIRKEHEKWGSRNAAKLFEEKCFDDDTMNRIMGIFLETEPGERVKFVNGADIEKIIADALAEPGDPAGLSQPISAAEWVSALRRVIRDPGLGTFGWSEANLDGIAACYIRLMRGSFVAAGETLLAPDCYERKWNPQSGRIEVNYRPTQGSLQGMPDYDRALHDAIASRVERIAERMENHELEKLCR